MPRIGRGRVAREAGVWWVRGGCVVGVDDHRCALLGRPCCSCLHCRVHPGVKLQRIPTLFKWGKGKAVASLVEDQCKDAGLVEDLVLSS